MIFLGIGAGIAFNPVLFAAMSDVQPSEAGLASGIVNTAFMMGGALGLAVLASLAASRPRRWKPPATAARGADGRLSRRVPRRSALRVRRRCDRRDLLRTRTAPADEQAPEGVGAPAMAESEY